MSIKSLNINLYTIPQEACPQGKMTWTEAALFLKNQMIQVYPDMVFEHIEFMSSKWFNDEIAQRLLEEGKANFPFVTVNGEVASSEKKINISKVRRVAELTINS